MNMGTRMEMRHGMDGSAWHKFRNRDGVRWVLDTDEMQSWRLERRGDVTEMDVRCKSWDLYADEMEPGCRWDANFAIWMGVRWGLYGSETQILGPGWDELGPGWIWDAICGIWRGWDVAWMVRHKYRDLAGDETWISGLGWWWDGTWMELICNCLDLDGGETWILGPGWK